MFGVSSGSEGVRRFCWDDIHVRFRDVCFFRNVFNNAMQSGIVFFVSGFCAVEEEDDFVAEPVADKVHDEREEERNG